MEQRSVRTYFVYSVFLVLLSMLIGWGCSQGVPEGIQSSQQSKRGKNSRQGLSFRMGAIHYMYADVYAQPDTFSERLTQCMYGDVVRIDHEETWWYSVRVGPYPELSGWIHKAAVTELAANSLYMKERNLRTIVIRQNISNVFVWPSQTMTIVTGTELPFLGESEEWYLVRLPTNDIGRIARDAVERSVVFQPLIQSKQKSVSDPQSILQQRYSVVDTAQRFLGKVYIWGGTTPRGFDCSGLSYFVYKLNGIELPRVSWLQFRSNLGEKINKSQLEHGDLVFFETYRRGPSHVGIYIGNNQFIHASPSSGVTTSNLDDPYFKKRYIGAKTIFSS